MHDKILDLEHYFVVISKEGYRVVNKHTKKVEFEHQMLPTTISTAEALNSALGGIVDEFEITF